MPIEHDTNADAPEVREGPGWRQTTGATRHYEDCAPSDDRWGATTDQFISMTSALRTGFPTSFETAAVYNVVDESLANWGYLSTLLPTERKTGEFGDESPSRREQMVAYRDVSLNRAANRGTGGHAYVEARLKGEQPNWEWMAEMGSLPWLGAIENFLHREQPELVFAETVAFDRDHMVAGTVDALVRFRGALWEIDWKGLALDTPIPTPNGWSTMADLQVGDEVFGADGRPCRVVGKSDVHQRPCYRISFDDKTSIVCDDEHLWEVIPARGEPKVLDTAYLADNMKKSGNDPRWRVGNALPLELPERDLPVHPYVLGVWLGDGCTHRGEITKPDARLWTEIDKCGYTFTPGEDRMTRTIYGLVTDLREAGVLHDKHVPDIYLRASRSQRLDLLAGLLDSDGTWNPQRGQAIFTNTNERLADAVYELVVSLGWRANKWTQIAHGFGVEVREWRIAFTPFGTIPFRSRAEDCDLPDRTQSKRRVIRSIEPIDTVPTQCIMVDSHDSLYLCGEQMVPTHNTRAQKSKRHFTHARRPKEAAQLGGYHRMLTAGYFMDARGRRQQVTEDLAVAVITFGEDGTYAIHEVDWWEAERAYDLAMDMREASKLSVLMPHKAIYSEDFDPNPALARAIDNVPDDVPEKMMLAKAWQEAGLGKPSKGEVDASHYGEAMHLIYRHTARFQPFAADKSEPQGIVAAHIVGELADRLRALPADIAEEARRNAAGLPLLSSLCITEADVEDWDRVLRVAEEAHTQRQREAINVYSMARQIDGALALLPEDLGTWTDRDLTLATAIVSAISTDEIGLDGASGWSTEHQLDLHAGKPGVKKLARERAKEYGLDVPSKWDDLVSDPVLWAVLVAT